MKIKGIKKLNDNKISKYIIIGILTTLINIIIFYILDKNNIEYKTSTTIANFISILFAYITNKIFVFKSKNWKLKFLLKEIWKFLISRLGTYFLDIFSMYMFVEILLLDNMMSKIIANILVIIANYILSNNYIFIN